MVFGRCVECKSYLIFKILLMLMEYRILLMGNTVEMAGGDIYSQMLKARFFPFLNEIPIKILVLNFKKFQHFASFLIPFHQHLELQYLYAGLSTQHLG